MRKQFLINTILILLFFSEAYAQNLWVEKKDNPELWRKIEKAFSEELLPAKDSDNRTYGHKFISRIAKAEAVCLVFIVLNTTSDADSDYDNYIAYSYDFRSEKKQKIEKSGSYKLVPRQWSFLEKSEFPDLIVRYQSCIDCEDVSLLAVFYYNSQERSWKIRNWPDDDQGFVIEINPVHKEIDEWELYCLWQVKDVTNDHYDDISIWKREVFSGKPQESLKIYTISDHVPKVIQVKDNETKGQASRLKQMLCKDHESNILCSKKLKTSK